MKIMYIFPHPDDESFGPAAAIDQQLKQGHEVHLLTLTRGGATKERFKRGLSISEMGEIRLREMYEMKKVLGLSGMIVWDLPDSGLQDLDPRELEFFIRTEIARLQPDILVTYPVHGISGFHDHLVIHAVIRRLYLQMRDDGAQYLKRLAFFTIPDNGNSVFQPTGLRIKQSDLSRIDCAIPLSDSSLEVMRDCLACYETYQDTIRQAGVMDTIGQTAFFEFYGEQFDPPVTDLCSGI